MKTQKAYMVATALAVAVMMLVDIPVSFGQSSGMRAPIPFDFYVEGKLMPAGTYYARTISSGSAVEIRDAKGHGAYVVATPATNRNFNRSTMVFHRYGKQYFLSELHWEGFDIGRVLRTSEAELVASKTTRPVAVEVPIAPKNK